MDTKRSSRTNAYYSKSSRSRSSVALVLWYLPMPGKGDKRETKQAFLRVTEDASSNNAEAYTRGGWVKDVQ